VGNALLQKAITHLQTSGVQCLKLDATPAGQPLYEKLGFQREWGLNRWERKAGEMRQQPKPESHRSKVEAQNAQVETRCTIRPFLATDLDAIVRLDALALGAPRRQWLSSLAKEARLIVSEAAGRVCGFGVMREGSHAAYCGPVVALETGAAHAIISELLSNCEPHRTVFWDVPVPNDSAEQLVREHRFLIQRPLVRMFHGTNAPGAVDYLYAIAGPEAG
jgi:ribosomal protein S18 acetylase RimI-like enzyme